MFVLISYDVATSTQGGAKRLRKIARICLNYGQRVQFSIFECNIDPTLWIKIKNSLIKEIDSEKDSLRFYFLGSNWTKKVEHIGAKKVINLEGLLII